MPRPLPAAAVGPARAYLTAMLPSGEVSDAWHDLEADAAYWGDQDLGAILHLAHEIVQQRVRVTHEAAALALLDDAGVDDATIVAACLGVDEPTALGLLDRAREELAGGPVADGGPVSPNDSSTAGAPREDPRPARFTDAPAPSTTATATPRPIRISFDDTDTRMAEPVEPVESDEPADRRRPAAAERDDGASMGPRTRAILVWAGLIWAVVLLAWLLGAFD